MDRPTPTYALYLDCPQNGREEIVTGEKDPNRVRRIATGKSFMKRLSRFGRKAAITKDNKELPGGATALDRICYEQWLRDNYEEDESTP